MSAIHDSSTDWQREVLALKFGPQQMAATDIAEVVGKHAATIRKVIARATEDEVAEILAADSFIPGQTTVDEQIAAATPGEPDAPEDDPERNIDPLDQFRSEAGEAVGPMPPQEPEDNEPVTETRIRGTRQMALDFGAEADIPVGGTLVLKSDKLASGFFDMGDVISGTFTARIVKIGGEEKFDSASEEFRAKPTAHVALITEFMVQP